MVFQDMGPIPEIDNELILFRELFKIKSKYHNSLLISQGGRIAQHLVEFLARKKRYIRHNIYNSRFEDFLAECEFIPNPIQEFILIIYDYRKNVVYSSKHEKELNRIMLTFFETFNQVLNWFRYFYHYEFYNQGINFKEIDTTIEFLNKQIKSNKNLNDNYKINENEYDKINSGEHLPDEKEMIRVIYESIPEIKNGIDTLIHTNDHQTNQLNNLNTTVNNIDNTMQDINNKIDQLTLQLKEIHEEYKNSQEEVANKINNSNLSDEEIDKIMSKFTNSCVKKIRTCINETFGDYKFKEEERELIGNLGEENWNKLENESKTFLITSKITYKSLNKLDNLMDYSGVCLLVTKALEVELTKRFCKWFLDYLKGKDYSEYHSSLLNINRKTGDKYKIKPKNCTLGTITFLLGFGGKDKPNEEYEKNLSISINYSKEKLFRNFINDENEIRKTLIEYGSYVDKIRLNYRNPAAHTGKLDITKSDECFRYVLEV